MFNRIQLFATPWAVARQAPLFMGFPRQELCSGLPFPSPGDLPDPRRFFTIRATCKAHTEYYSAISRNEVLLHAHTWVSLENKVLSQRSHSQNPTYCLIPFIPNVQDKQTVGTESGLVIARGWTD